MKKKIVLQMALMCVVALVGCGNVDPVSQKVMDDIDSIGEVTLEDSDIISKTIDLYSTLTDEQKNQVKNYTTLLSANEKLEQLKEEDAAAQKAKVEASYNEEPYGSAINAVAHLKNSLLNPSSFTMSRCEAYLLPDGDCYMFSVDFGGENKMGGMTTDNVIIFQMIGKANDYSICDMKNSNYSSNSLMITLVKSHNGEYEGYIFIENMDTKRIISGIEYKGL